MFPPQHEEQRSLRVLKPYTAPKVTILTSERAEEKLQSEVFLGNTAKEILAMKLQLAKKHQAQV
jgi:hypothetical protein